MTKSLDFLKDIGFESLDFMRDVRDALKKQKIDYVIVAVRKNHKNDRMVNTMHEIAGKQSLDLVKEALCEIFDLTPKPKKTTRKTAKKTTRRRK